MPQVTAVGDGPPRTVDFDTATWWHRDYRRRARIDSAARASTQVERGCRMSADPREFSWG